MSHDLNPLNDPLWLVIVKVVAVFALLLTWTIFNVWFERRVIGRMQNRRGPTMNGPLGLGQALGDGMKLIFKEDFRPARTDAVVFSIAPMLTAVAAFTVWTVIPLGGNVTIFGVDTRLQITDLPVSILFILAVAAVGFYGVVLAGWASNGTYSLLGSMRATAQIISYEVCMGLSLIPVFILSQSASTGDVVKAQQIPWLPLPGGVPDLPSWYFLLLIPSFVIFLISMLGECNRLPFDFAECESEIVSGHLTDFSGFRYALYFLAEYINMATTSAICATVFLGGYTAPWPLNQIAWMNDGWFTLVWFILKVQLLIFGFVWVRGSLPRYRYDKFMALGWKVLIPVALVWTMLVALFRTAGHENWFSSPIFIGVVAVIFIAVLALVWFSSGDEAPEPDPLEKAAERQALPGAYPTPVLSDSLLEAINAPASQKQLVGSSASRDTASANNVSEGADS